MVTVAINPGTGPVGGATLAEAEANVRAFVADLDLPGVVVMRDPEEDRQGRFGFWLTLGARRCDLDMPGLPLARVRYVRAAGQNIWDFPRLYVDGGSWVWCYGTDIARAALTRAPGQDESGELDTL